MYTVDLTFGHHSKKFTCMESSVHAHGSEIRGRSFKLFKNIRGTHKDWDSAPLTSKFANVWHTVIQGQWCFTKHGLLKVIPHVV